MDIIWCTIVGVVWREVAWNRDSLHIVTGCFRPYGGLHLFIYLPPAGGSAFLLAAQQYPAGYTQSDSYVAGIAD